MATPDSITALLEQTSWVQNLARRLVQDPSTADDLAQDTLVRALEERPDAQRSLRGWLATVMRSSLGKRRRGEGNRSARERASSRDEAGPSTLDVVERAATHGDVVQAVLGLEEPYRSTILMRFFDQLSYGEIAKRLRVSEATVNSRITRGLERLRQRLSAAYGGDRHALFLALAPLAKSAAIPAATVPFAGVKLMNLALGATTLSVVAVTVSLGLKNLTEPARGVEPVLSSVSRDVVPEPATSLVPAEEVALPAAATQRVAASESAPSVTQQTRDANRWETTLTRYDVLPVDVESLLVNTNSGDVTVVPTNGGSLEIKARISARLDRVERSALTQVFEDHVDVQTGQGQLRIDTLHKNQQGWSVSFTVGVPRDLAVGANSGSGDVEVRVGSGSVKANTGSGDVSVVLPNAQVKVLVANTGSGDVRVEAQGADDKVTANTGSGDVEVRLHTPLSVANVKMNTGSGDVTLTVPPAIVGRFSLQTGSGDLSFPPALGLTETHHGGASRDAAGSVGAGGGVYELSTGSGDVEIHLER